LKKKVNSVVFHFCRERTAARVVSIGWVPTDKNIADMFTKSQPGPVRIKLAEQVLF
jgi:hypothetical protein